HETDPVRLITQTPEVLTRTGGYHNVWIALFDNSGHVAMAAESGLDEVVFRQMQERLDTGDLPGCVRSTLAEEDVVVTENPASDCPGCPLSATCSADRGVMTTRVESGGRVYGVISITVPGAFVNDKDEQALFMDATRDIAFALHAMDLEEERAAAHQTMLDIIEFLPDATFVIDRDGQVITWNRAIEEMTGIKAKDMIGKGDYEYAIPFYGTRRAILIDLAFAAEDEHWLRDHYSHIRTEGDVLIADTTLPRPLGRKSILMGTASPLYDKSGRVVGAIESIRDITERKAAEHALEMANKKLQLLSGVTRHDILNQITGLAGYTDLLGEVLPDDPDMRKYIDRITKATSAIERQITFTRDYEHLGVDPSGWQCVADAAERAASVYADRGVNVSIGTGALEIFADPMVEKVFLNLFDNAVRHGEHVTEISVTCREEDGDGSVVIAVEDDGVGVPAEIKEKI
ncbi:MAG: PAS domain S-box protein, partial [Deltaproteobacteria bacterium]|nr:PAS domain S-box protein [Deltaproteobacteria bacterium]